MANIKSGEEFLNRLYKDLWKTAESLSSNRKTPNLKTTEQIKNYINRLESIHIKGKERKSINKLLREFYYKKYIIKRENILENYFEQQKRIALERGHGHITITEQMKEEMSENIINDQKASLDSWLDYFESGDTNQYPMWFKYWVFQGMLKLGVYDKATNKFRKRTRQTISPFMEINSEVLAKAYDLMNRMLNRKEISEDVDLNKLINNGSFQKIYTHLIIEHYLKTKVFEKRSEGIWKKYNQGSDHIPLVESLEGYGTGWCTAGESTAELQLKNGDFYVYYTNDGNGNYTVPRIAIRMESNSIAEIRGTADNQNLEGEMIEVADKKLAEFPDKNKYKKKVKNMKTLTAIYYKDINGQELTKSDLKFLYEMDEKIEGFGYQKDPRIKEITNRRDKREDLSHILGCDRNQISLTEKEALGGNIIFHYGYLDLRSLTSLENVDLPDSIGGGLYLDALTSLENVDLPDSIGGGLYLGALTSLENVDLPDSIGGDLDLSSLTSLENVDLPDSIGRDLDLRSLTSLENVDFPDSIGRDLDLRSLTSLENVDLPDSIGRDLDLGSLTSLENVDFPDSIGRDLDLSSLTSLEGIELLDIINIKNVIYNNRWFSFNDFKNEIISENQTNGRKGRI